MCVAFLRLRKSGNNANNPVSPTWSSGGWTTVSDNQNGPPGTGSVRSAAGAFATQQTSAIQVY